MIKKIDSSDPFYSREAGKYANPIPSREFIIQHLEKLGSPERYVNLVKVCNLQGKESRKALRWRLSAMLRDGQLLTDRKGRYALVKQLSMLRGYVICHKDGYGFLVPDDGSGDLFLNPRQMRILFPGDRVLASVVATQKENKREGVVIEVLERSFVSVVGRYSIEKNLGFIIPSNKNITQEIIIPHGQEGGAKKGQFVVANITSYPSFRSGAIGKIVQILGKKMLPRLEIEIAINAHGLPHLWPSEVTHESRLIEKSKEPLPQRRQLQHLPLVTIDGEDAKDFDDAIYCEPDANGWVLYVAIADVSHYVGLDTALDQEALKRGNSVYFPEYVVPMLPEVLSNELCSLKPDVERLVMVCQMAVTNSGKVVNYEFYGAVIKSHARLTYDGVLALLENKTQKTSKLLPHLQELRRLYHSLLKQRKDRGALDFSRVEVKIVFSEQHQVKCLEPIKNHYVHGMVEECMLAANVCASQFLLHSKIPSLYRVHAGPDASRLKDLRAFLKGLGLELKGGEQPKSKHYADVLKNILGRPDEHLVQTVLLRSLRQAIYTAKNIGHFGLAYEAYAHFTSPIRRYSDLINHRAIKHLVYGSKAGGGHRYANLTMQGFGNHCSLTERRADEASRDVVMWLKCEFMKDKVGKTFIGIISGVVNFGVFVEVKDIFVEGLIHVTSLKNDYYKFDPLHYRLVGKSSGTVYQLGDPIKVVVMKVDLDEREINFELA